MRSLFFALPALLALLNSLAHAADPLPGTQPLTREGDFSAQMVAGIDQFLLRELDRTNRERGQRWKPDHSSPAAYSAWLGSQRTRLSTMIGAVDRRLEVKELELAGGFVTPAKVAETDKFTVFAVRWPVFEGVFGEGLLIQPKGRTKARIIALPDADQTPEQLVGLAPGIAPESQFARRLAEQDCQVLVPTLVDRKDYWSGNSIGNGYIMSRFTNQPHREWIYRQSYEVGRHIIGYEVQKILAALDVLDLGWERLGSPVSSPSVPPKIGVVGYGEGGLLALHAAATSRIQAVLVSGYFDERLRVWEEPIYRNVFGFVRDFGDAELASLISPRTLVVEHSAPPKIDGPPAPRQGRAGAAPGKITTPDFASVEREIARARAYGVTNLHFIHGNEGTTTPFGSTRALTAFLAGLGVQAAEEPPNRPAPADLRRDFDPAERQQRQVKQLEAHTQHLLALCGQWRNESFWSKHPPAGANHWADQLKATRTYFWTNVIGKLPSANVPLNPQSREILNTDKLTGYDVTLDVWPDVFAWGVLLLPKNLQPGERRPVVVCQHGLEGVPMDTVTTDEKARAWQSYKGFATALAERGFIVFAPHNPYRGQDKFRTLQRKANPLGTSLFSVIFEQHERILDWLSAQPFVDAQRIGFYGLSYGGKSAMRIPAALDRYALSICSADFNEWVWKNATVDWRGSYMFTGEYEIFEWNLGHTFNYAEMAALIAPRPFMVERGHDDGVGVDEWVNFEFAKIRRLYTKLGIGDRTEIEHFDGPHTINGQGTFDFLHKHLNWPKR